MTPLQARPNATRRARGIRLATGESATVNLFPNRRATPSQEAI
ncbi:hypothetical protein [Agromyces cavernae]|nr:hypothetical protein [Agromyces cavernae]